MSPLLPPDDEAVSSSRAWRVDAACLRFEEDWVRGGRPCLKTYLAGAPAQDRPVLLRELLALELEYRDRGGERPCPDDYLAQFPEHAALIRTVFDQAKSVPYAAPGGGRPDNQPPCDPGRTTAVDSAVAGGAGPPPGEVPALPAVPGYQVLELVGRGGMGIVYKARHLALNRVVALKMIRPGLAPGATERARFRREAEAVARLRHANVIQIYEVGDHDGQPFLSLEFCAGGSLKDRLGAGPLGPADAARLMEQAARAMQASHDQGIAHRDLKPANVLLQGDAAAPVGDCEVKVTDFGLAKRLGAGADTQSGAVVGTCQYMAPEQARGKGREVGSAADIYALGSTLYACLTGEPPFHGASDFDVLSRVIAEEPVPPSRLNRHCPRDLETICLKCLEKRPADRYASAGLLADDLGRYREGRPILARPAGPTERLLKWVRRAPAQAAAVAAGLALVLALLGVLYGQLRSAQRDAEWQRHQAGLRERFAELYSRADQAAAAATPADEAAWANVERDVGAALELIRQEPAFADLAFREPAERLLARARGELADARERQGHQARLARLKALVGEAVCFGTLATGLEPQDSNDRARRAVAEGLKLFGVSTDNDGPPDADPRLCAPDDDRIITAACYVLLLIDAEVLAHTADDTAETGRDRLRQALRRLDRADRLQPGLRTRAGLARRAVYLARLGDETGARQARQEAELTAPSQAADYFLLGMDQYGRDDFREAIKSLVNALRLQPGHYGAEYLLAVCRLREAQSPGARGRLREGHLEDAKVGLSRCLEQRPDFPWPRLLRGYAEMELGDFNAARADFDAVLDDPPDATASYVALVNRGVLAMYRRLWDDADADLRQAVKLRPDDVVAYVNLALTLRQRAEVPPVSACTLLLAPRGAYALLALQANGRPALAEAVAVLDKIIGRRPNVARLYHERGRLHLLRNDLTAARTDFTQAVAWAPGAGAASTLPDDLIELGQLLHREGKYADAVKAYEAALAVRPGQADAHRLLARSLLAAHHGAEAGAALDRYLAMSGGADGRPTTPAQVRNLADAFRMRGLIHAEQADFRRAIESYTQGLTLKRDAETLALRGWAHLHYESAREALPDFEEALKLRPASADLLLGRADARVELGQVKEALADAGDGLRSGPATYRIQYLAARVYSQAAARLNDPPAGARASPDNAADCEGRAVELLRAALAQMPAGEQAAFWRDKVQRDAAFNAIRSHRLMRALEQEYLRPASGSPPAARGVNQQATVP